MDDETTPSQAPQASQAAAQAQRRDLPLQARQATIVPGTFNADERTVDVVWTVGARVRRYDYWNDTPYEEELVVTPEAVDMSRFDAGAVQALDNHRVYGGVDSILGIATRGWIEGGEGHATLRLSGRPEKAGVVSDIQAGIIRTISVGYAVQRYEITRAQDREDGVNMPLYRAARWQPMELSFVTVPADAAAGTRSAAGRTDGSPPTHHLTVPCEFVTRGPLAPAAGPAAETQTRKDQSMDEDETTGGTQAPATPQSQGQRSAPAAPPAAPAASDAVAAATQRAADITALCQRHGAGDLATELIRSGATMEVAQSRVLDQLAVRDAATGGHRNVQVETITDEVQTRLNGITEAILHRVDSRTKLTDNGRQFRGMSLLELGRDHLERQGVRTRGMERMALAAHILQHRSAGFQSTSDFGGLFGNVASKRLRGSYEENPGTYQLWARRAPNAPDFKSMSVVQLSGAPDLLQTNEHGEFKYGALKDGNETYALLTYGRIVALTRQAIINDDLRAFDRLVTAFGGAARRLENRLVYQQLAGNPTMGDGKALFHADHGNLGTAGSSALQFSALGTARAAMRLQKGLQNEELNLSPNFLIVPAALEQTAYQLTSSNYVPAKQADVNEFRTGGRTAVEPIVEPVLDAISSNAWYLASNSSQVDTVEYCYLDGAEGPQIETELGFEVDGIQFKCREDFAAKAIDWRGLYRANGA